MNLAHPLLSAILCGLIIEAVLFAAGKGSIPAEWVPYVIMAANTAAVVVLWWLVETVKELASGVTKPAPVDGGKPIEPPGPLQPPAKPPVDPPATKQPRFTGITATCFGGSADPNTSAYDKHLITDAELGAALPFHFPNPVPAIRVFSGGAAVDCKLVDVGPWNTNDPYWQSGSRPEAESGTDNTGRRTNLAGLDLTPAVWAKLGKPGTGKAKVDWDFVDVLGAPAAPGPSPASSVSGAAIIAIVTSLDGEHWTSGGPDPTITSWIEFIATKWPDLATYARGFEHVGYFAWCGLTVGYVMSKAGYKPPGEFFLAADWLKFGTKVDQAQPGDVLVYQWGDGSHHVSIYDQETDGDYYASHGGNQSHTVNVTKFPMASCIGIRRPA